MTASRECCANLDFAYLHHNEESLQGSGQVGTGFCPGAQKIQAPARQWVRQVETSFVEPSGGPRARKEARGFEGESGAVQQRRHKGGEGGTLYKGNLFFERSFAAYLEVGMQEPGEGGVRTLSVTHLQPL